MSSLRELFYSISPFQIMQVPVIPWVHNIFTIFVIFSLFCSNAVLSYRVMAADGLFGEY